MGLEQAQTLEFEILVANLENMTQSVSNFTICVRTEERRLRQKELREGWWKKEANMKRDQGEGRTNPGAVEAAASFCAAGLGVFSGNFLKMVLVVWMQLLPTASPLHPVQIHLRETAAQGTTGTWSSGQLSADLA